MKAAAAFVLKSVVFVAIFWSLWIFIFKPLNAYVSASGDSSSQASNSDSQDKLVEKYWQQARLADQIQAKYMEQAKASDEYQKRYEALLTKQDEILTRLDLLVRKWDAQVAPRK